MKRNHALAERETFHLEVPADENNLSEVRDFIADICDRAGFSKSETNNTKLAVDEACTNIIKHAYKDKGGDIRIDVQAEPGKVEINIFDRGEPFDWSKVKEPDLDLYVEIGKKGGLGIYLMNRLMDSLSYSAAPGGNRLFMTKTSSVAAAHPPLFASLMKPRWTSTLRFKFATRATLGLLGLIAFLWSILFYRQTLEVNGRFAQAWLQRKTIAEGIAASSENALAEDQFSVERTRLSDTFIKQTRKYPEVRYIRLVDANGVIVSSSNIDELLSKYDVPSEVLGLSQGGAFRTIRAPDAGAIREFHQPVYRAGADGRGAEPVGRVVLGVSEAMVSEDLNDPRPMMTLLLIGVFAAGVALIYLLIAVFVRPIQALTDGVRAIGEGSLNDEIKIEGPKEIGEIARAFNEITSKFREAQKNVVEQERLQKEMQVAQEIQHTLLPKRVPEIGGYDIASYYKAAKEVGGDYYDFVKVDDDTLGVVVADVSGKGVPGSLVMTMIRTALRMEARGNYSAAEVMARMNDFVTEDMKKGMFVTIFYSILDSKNRIISYASAGHNPMILYRAETDETYFLNPRGFPVGISLPDDTLFRRSIDVEKVKLKKDDMLVIYTDGVTEAMNEQREQYGEERLLQLIKTSGKLSPQEFIDRLSANIKDFTGDQPQNDDITVVAIKEKLMADEVLYGIRRRLLDLVEIQGIPVAEACRMMKVSPSTYYRYKKRLVEMGDRGLQDKTLRQEQGIKRVSLEQRKEILEIIRRNPKYGAKKIASVFNEGKEDADHLTQAIVYDELKRIRLNTYEMRLEYMRRNRFISDEEFKTLISAHARAEGGAPSAAGADEATSSVARAPEETAVPRVPRAPRPARAAARSRELRVAHEEGFESGETRAVEVVSEELEGGIVVLKVKGHLDSSSAGELEGILESVHEYGYRKIIVNLKNVTYISSGGWGIFTGRVKALREGDGDVVLVGMSSEVYDIYELLGFQEIIMQFPEIEDAVQYLSLPLVERQERLDEISRRSAALKPLEVKQSAESPVGPGILEVAESESPWTALKIEAGTVGDRGEITILYLDGIIDTVSCVKLRSVMDSFVDRGTVKLVIDMSRVEYVSFSGWGVFASRIKDIRVRGGDIKIFGMDEEVNGIFHMLGFDSIMRSFGILAEAIENFKNAPPAVEEYEEPLDEETPEPGSAPRAGAAEGGSRADRAAERGLVIGVSKAKDGPRGIIVFTVGGAVDSSTSEEFENRLEQCIAENPAHLVLDLSDVVYISSSGWGIIVKFMQRLGDSGGTMAIAGMNSMILKIFGDLGFDPLIPHFGTLERALTELKLPKKLEEVSRKERIVPGDAKTAQRREPVDAAIPRKEPRDPAAPAGPAGDNEDLASALLGKADIIPLEPLKPVKEDEKVIFIDFKQRTDVREEKDARIKKMGWEEYGKKLIETDKNPRHRKK